MDWRDVLEEKDDIDQGPYHHLYKICDLESSLTCGSQGIFVKRHGEDFGAAWSRQETLQREIPAVFLCN